MGEIADMMIDGSMCEGCGEYLGEGDGYSRRCSACGGGRRRSSQEKDADVAIAAEQYTDASRILKEAGAALLRHSEYHYSIRRDGWILHVYPSNCRLYSPTASGGARAPFIRIATPWTLIDVARAVAESIQTQV